MVKNNSNISSRCTKCGSDRRKRMAKVKNGPINRISMAQVKVNTTNQFSAVRVEDYADRLSHLKAMAPLIKKWLFDNPDVRVEDGDGSNFVITTVETVYEDTVETVYEDVCLETLYKDVCLSTYFYYHCYHC